MTSVAEAQAPKFVDDPQEQLVQALRMELEEYGGLLSHFETQQEAILNRKADEVLEIGGAIEKQIEKARTARRLREALARQLAQAAGCPEQISLRELAPYFRPAVRPMIEALTDEVNRLMTHTKRRAQQNQMLLSRAMEVTQEILSRLSPETVTRTYSPGGKMRMHAAGRGARLVELG